MMETRRRTGDAVHHISNHGSYFNDILEHGYSQVTSSRVLAFATLLHLLLTIDYYIHERAWMKSRRMGACKKYIRVNHPASSRYHQGKYPMSPEIYV
jgi:uncharacterized membrane protein